MRKNKEKHAPPLVRLNWDRDVFEGVLERLDVTYVLFSPEGVPLRARLGITLLKVQKVSEMVQEEPVNSPDVEKTWVARRGDTLAGISAAVYADPRLWREIARANGIEDPRRLRPGTVLTVPRLR
jgi:nucleoid-associated protein YgaU